MTTWTLIVIFSWLSPSIGWDTEPQIAHSGFSVSGFATRQACRDAQEAMRTPGSKSTCVPTK